MWINLINCIEKVHYFNEKEKKNLLKLGPEKKKCVMLVILT